MKGMETELLERVARAIHVRHGMTLRELEKVLRADPRGGFKEGVMMYGRHAEYDR